MISILDEIIEKVGDISKNKSNFPSSNSAAKFLSRSTFEILDFDVKKKLVTALILNNEENISPKNILQCSDEKAFLSKSKDDLLDWVCL